MALNDYRSNAVLADSTALGLGRRAKRLVDILAASATLALLSPTLLIVSVAIKLDFPGPVFAEDAVYGYRNRSIRILRFRTVAAGVNSRQPSCLTRVGRVICRSGIDELPLLLSVLRGDMSIVGPPPYAGRWDLLDNRLMPLLDVKPGIVSWPPITLSPNEPMSPEQRVKNDLHYVENWSLLLDIKIILMSALAQRAYESADR